MCSMWVDIYAQEKYDNYPYIISELYFIIMYNMFIMMYKLLDKILLQKNNNITTPLNKISIDLLLHLS